METINNKNLSKYELPELEQKGLFRRWYYKPTQSAVSKKEYFFAADDFLPLKTAIEQGRFDTLQKLHRQSDGNVKLVVVSTKDGKFAAVQVFRYQPFEFRPETEIVVLKEADAAAFL
ncbi:MAG: hypothetical protein IJ057_00175 [Bacteroidales bacterium]|nr:hypothetical protein [Bacteroidales bacterium]